MIVIGVGCNPDKSMKDGFISPEIEARVDSLKDIYKDDVCVVVKAYSDLTVDFAERNNAVAIVKGVRSIKDFEYEREQADINKALSGIDTVLFYSRPELSAVSSSAVRTLKVFGKDVSSFLPSTRTKNHY